jgi:hypothetical protein
MEHKAKVENQSAWKTKNGFQIAKKDNMNEHPKKPHRAV